jgi:hypothetical protein
MHCAQVVRDDFDTVLKAIFRARSETARVDIADAFGRHYNPKYKLGTEFQMAVDAVRHCLKIRNQYAHCVWWDDYSGNLAFANLEEIAQHNAHVSDLRSLTTFHVDEPLLSKQEAYFVYADDLLSWVNMEGRKRAGKVSTQPLSKPKQIAQPPLHIP